MITDADYCNALHTTYSPIGVEYSPVVFVTVEWVTWNRQRIIWLPSEWRPTSVTLKGSLLVMGHNNGRVTFTSLDFHANFGTPQLFQNRGLSDQCD